MFDESVLYDFIRKEMPPTLFYEQEALSEDNHPINFFTLSSEDQQALLKKCELLKPTKSYNYNHSTQVLKNIFGVTNGQIKGALILSGFKPSSVKKKNWYFNISSRLFSKELNYD